MALDFNNLTNETQANKTQGKLIEAPIQVVMNETITSDNAAILIHALQPILQKAGVESIIKFINKEYPYDINFLEIDIQNLTAPAFNSDEERASSRSKLVSKVQGIVTESIRALGSSEFLKTDSKNQFVFLALPKEDDLSSISCG